MNHKKQILFISNPLKEQYGGGEKVIESLITGVGEYDCVFLGRSKYLEKFFKKTDRKFTRAFFGFEPVTVVNILLLPLSLLISLIQVLRYFKLFKESNLIVFPAGFTEIFSLYPFLFLMRKKVVQLIHSNRCPKSIYESPILFILKFAWSQVNVVFVSNSQKKEWFDKNIQPKKFSIIYNGVKISDYLPVYTKTDTIKIGFLGRLHKEKGVDVFLKSLEFVKYKENIQVLIAGTGPEEKYLKFLAKEVELKTNIPIKFVGFQEDPSRFLSDLDLSIFPSYRESFGMVLVESLEKGIPVVCSDLKPFLEITNSLPDEFQKLIFKSGDKADLSVSINYYLENLPYFKDTNNKMILHNLAKRSFSLETMLENYKTLFEKIT